MVAEIVLMVRVPVAAAAPVMFTEFVTPQVGGVIPPGGLVSTQVRFTPPVNPFEGVTLIVEVFPVVAPAATVTPPLFDKANPAAPLATCVRRPSVWTYSPVAASVPVIRTL